MAGSRAGSQSNVRRLRPVRVLVAADDPRFLAVATILLSRAEFAVESTTRLGDVVALVERDRANAVVLDATTSVAAAARCAAALARLRRAVKVVFVVDDAAAACASLNARAKWDAFPEIIAELAALPGGLGAAEPRLSGV